MRFPSKGNEVTFISQIKDKLFPENTREFKKGIFIFSQWEEITDFSKMSLKWKVIVVVLILLNIDKQVIDASIECHDCGMLDICTIPYVKTSVSKVDCKDSCMKFDGKDPDGKRVVARSCGQKHMTECITNTKWNGGVGELCYSNTIHCNISPYVKLSNSIAIFAILFILFVVG